MKTLFFYNEEWEKDYFQKGVGTDFDVALAGSNVRQQADEFEAARERLGERVVHYGRAGGGEYARLLWQADVVVSTALHEFFGIAIVEAMYCGCFPVLPRRLAYPERIPAQYHRQCLYDGELDGFLERLRWVLTHTEQAREIAGDLAAHVQCFDWGHVVSRYDAVLEAMVKG